mgnify:CR=1 FL=1
MAIRITPLHPLFAAEVGGLNLSLRFGESAPFGEATARALREALRATPQERLLVETDAPYLPPKRWRGRPNASYLLGDTVRFVDRSPPRLLVTGRTAYGLSAFGEHLTGDRRIASEGVVIGGRWWHPR